MKAYFLLLRLSLQNQFAGLKDGLRKENGKLDISRLLLYPVALLGVLSLVGVVIFMEITLGEAFHQMGQLELLPGLALLLSMIATLMFSVFHMFTALYFSRDTVSMAYLPLKSRTVLAARWSEVYLTELLFSAMILAPALILYGVKGAMDWTYYLRMLPVLLAVNCIPLTVSLLLSSVLGRFTALTKHKEVWVVLGTVLMMVVVLGLEWTVLPKIPEDADAAFFLEVLTGAQSLLQTLVGAFPPILWAVKGLSGDWLHWALYLLVSVGGAAVAIALLGGGYLNSTLKQAESSRKARRIRTTDKTFRQRSAFWAIYCREWNEILHVPVYLLNCVMGALMLPIILFGMSIGLSASEDSMSLMVLLDMMKEYVSSLDVILILTAAFAISSWLNPMIATAVSREGKRLPIAKMIPVSPRIQLAAKLCVSLTINAVGMGLIGVAAAVLLGKTYWLAILVALLLGNLFSLATGCVVLSVDAARPMLHWKTEQQVMKQSMNQMIAMALTTLMMLLVGAGVLGMFFLCEKAGAAQNPAAWQVFLAAHPAGMRIAACVTLVLLETGLSLLLIRKYGEKRYAALEP